MMEARHYGRGLLGTARHSIAPCAVAWLAVHIVVSRYRGARLGGGRGGVRGPSCRECWVSGAP